MPHVLTFGNEKGGTGKSTLAVHVAVACAWRGVSVAVVDADLGQGSTTRYLRHRQTFMEQHAGKPLPTPTLVDAQSWDRFGAAQIFEEVRSIEADIAVLDTPGFLTDLSQHLHACADQIITPLNDSLIDLAVLADVHPDTGDIRQPSHYAERVWEARKLRAAQDGGSISWIVLRNRLSALDAHNKRLMADILAKLSSRVGCQVGPGFGERVIFRELFLQGLTLSDFEDRSSGLSWTMSHVAARQELRALLDIIGLDGTLSDSVRRGQKE